jgi:CubicO group peptidase (beta-lactamase class C family)
MVQFKLHHGGNNPVRITKPENLGFSSERLCRIRPIMQRYVDNGQLAGMITAVERCGELVHFDMYGMMNLESGTPMTEDAIFRIYSMSKPITSTAVMMLFEEGCFRLNDPVSRYLPMFKEMKVIAKAPETGSTDEPTLEDAAREITIRDLLTHTAGLSYGFMENDYLDELYRENVWKALEAEESPTLQMMIEKIARLPLAFHPGTRFNYSMATDVLGYLVEVVSGIPFEDFLRTRIFEPLGMVDTGFWVPPEKAHRLAHMYGPKQENGTPVAGQLMDIDPPENCPYLRYNPVHSGGGGLVSTTADYLRFCRMLLNGGELDSDHGAIRLLGRKTVETMVQNHLPDGVFIDPDKSRGFGLGGYVLLDVAKSQQLGTIGMWGWGGAANTKFWIDFEEDLIGVLMVQYMPSDLYPLEQEYQNLVYQALVE